jgi:hypothetical protein
MILEIAKNDWGEQVEEHRAGILYELTCPGAPNCLYWNPREVLELERNVTTDWPATPERWTRGLLPSAILLRWAGHIRTTEEEADFFFETSSESVRVMAESAMAVRGDAPALALAFLLWLIKHNHEPILRPFVSFGVLALQIIAGQHDQAGLELIETCGWVRQEELTARTALGKEATDWWLIGLNYQLDARYKLRPPIGVRWAPLAARLLPADDTDIAPAVRQALSDLRRDVTLPVDHEQP